VKIFLARLIGSDDSNPSHRLRVFLNDRIASILSPNLSFAFKDAKNRTTRKVDRMSVALLYLRFIATRGDNRTGTDKLVSRLETDLSLPVRLSSRIALNVDK